jgi:hypothetical protein
MTQLADDSIEPYITDEPIIYIPIKKRQIIITVPNAYAVELTDTGIIATIRITSSLVLSYPTNVIGANGANFYIVTLPYDYALPIINHQPILTLHGLVSSGAITLTYSSEPNDFTDDIVATAWPRQCLPLFIRGLLDAFYEYDMDERAANSYSFNQVELSKLKAWDNLHKPKSQPNRHGYRRTR